MNFDRASYGFWDEQDPRGGIFPGKTYTSAREFLNQFVNNLKTKEDVSKQYIDNLYKCFYNKFNRF